MISALLALLLLALTAVPAAAEEELDYNETEYQIADSYCFVYIRDSASQATRFSMLYYISADDLESYIPKTLLDVELTPEIFNGDNISRVVPPFRIDADNAYYSVRDGALYTKDGKTLLCVPHAHIYGRHAPDESFWSSGMYTIPDGTQEIAADCNTSDYAEGTCTTLFIDPDFTQLHYPTWLGGNALDGFSWTEDFSQYDALSIEGTPNPLAWHTAFLRNLGSLTRQIFGLYVKH